MIEGGNVGFDFEVEVLSVSPGVELAEIRFLDMFPDILDWLAYCGLMVKCYFISVVTFGDNACDNPTLCVS